MPPILPGSLAPWRAGGFSGNHFTHSSFIPTKMNGREHARAPICTGIRRLVAVSGMIVSERRDREPIHWEPLRSAALLRVWRALACSFKNMSAENPKSDI